MAYNKGYRKSGYRKNNYYRNNKYDRNNRNAKIYEIKPQDNKYEFDASKYKKKDIRIRDLNGKEYVISGNFAGAYSVELTKQIDKIKKFEDSNYNINDIPEIYDILKDMALKFINMNIDGIKYTIDDIDKGFNDINVLYNLVTYITRLINNDQRKTV